MMEEQNIADQFGNEEAFEVEESEEDKLQRLLILESFSKIVKGLRSDAIEGRLASGIEQEWQEDEDHYEGCDGLNRGSMVAKPRTVDGAFEHHHGSMGAARSTVFLKITRPYVDAAAARVADMLLPTDDRNWAIRVTPMPELVKLAESEGVASQLPQQLAQPTQPGMMSRIGGAISGMFGGQQAASGAAQKQMAPTPAQLAKQTIEQAKESAELAQEQIDDWHVECRYHAEVRKVIENSARIGTGILKGPIPKKMKSRAVQQTPDGWVMHIEQKVNPASTSVDPWNFYPDPNCGENIQDGDYCFERGDITARKLRDLKGMESDGYIDEMIDICLEEGPINAVDGTRKLKQNQKLSDKDLFEIWYFYGMVSRKDMEAAGCECDGEEDQYPCVVTMVNDRVIKITMSPLDSGEFPYDVMVWQARIGFWAGIGVSRQMRECQKGANAAVRNLMDNAGLSSGPQIIINRSKIIPADGKWEISPRKIWWSLTDEDVEDVRDAFFIVNIQSLQAELMNILQFWLKEAEDVTGLPMLIQGQQGKAPETVGGMTMLNNNATSVLRRIARTFDDRVTEPHIGRYYEYLLLHGPNDAKGDFMIDARGSSALVERDLQNQALMQIVGLAVNPAYGLDPENVVAEVLKSMRFDTKKFVMSDEKKEQIASQQPPEDPRITAAKINADARMKQRGAELQFEREENSLNRQLKQMEMEIDERLATAELSSEERRDLERQKVLLASVTLKLNVQRDLSLAADVKDLHKYHNPAPQVVNPAAEPSGRARPGRSFQE